MKDRHAVAFEHEFPEEVLGRIYVALDRPETCPHGFPIPAHEVDELPPLPPLGSLEPGDRAVVAVPGSTGADVVAFLETLGLRPGVEVEVREKHPFEGPVVLRVGDVDRTLSFRLAEQISLMRGVLVSDQGTPVMRDIAAGSSAPARSCWAACSPAPRASSGWGSRSAATSAPRRPHAPARCPPR